MSSLSDRLAALNRANEAAAGESAPIHDSPAPKRRADVPTDAPSAPSRPPTPAGGSAGNAAAGSSGMGGASQIRSGPSAVSGSSGGSAASRAEAVKDRFEDLKESVHTELLQQLGPQLYDANLEAAELESKVRNVLAEVLAASNRPLTRGDRERITQDIADDILG